MYAFKIRERKHFEVEAQFSSSQIRSIFIFDEVSREVLKPAMSIVNQIIQLTLFKNYPKSRIWIFQH